MRRLPVSCFFLIGLVVLVPCRAEAAFSDELSGLTLSEALDRLRAAGLNVIYSSQFVRPEMSVASEPEGHSPLEILDAILAPHGLAVKEGPEGVLLVVPGRDPRLLVSGCIQGVVRGADSGQPIPGVEVRLGSAGPLVWSDSQGLFRLENVVSGTYGVIVRISGYVESVEEGIVVTPGEATEIDFDLVPQPRFLQEVVVTPSLIGFLHPQPEGRQFLDRDEVQQLPHLSDDLFRVMPWLPGTTAGDISSEFGIRGGAPDEVLFLLDGMQVHEPYHLRDFFSLFSVVDSEIVDGMDLLSGGFPVEYGDRMSGVVELDTILPGRSGWSFGATGVHARMQVEGVLSGGVGSWVVSARRGYLDWLLNWLESIDEEADVQGSPKYWDLFATVRRQIGERSVLSMHLLTSSDHVVADDLEELETASGRGVSWYLWTSLFSSFGGGLSARTVASATRVERQFEGSSQPAAVSTTSARDDRSFSIYGLDQSWVLEPWRSHLFKWGLGLRRVSAAYDVDSTFVVRDPVFTLSGPPRLVRRQVRLRPDGWQAGLYAADRVRLSPGVTLEAGVRWDHQSWTPGDDQLSPRLNLVWETGDLGTVRASWGLYAQSQAIYELQVEDGVDSFNPAQRAEHRVVSWERALPSGLLLRVDGYHKIMSDSRPRFENLSEATDLFPEGELDRVEVAPERAEARGVEVLLKGRSSQRFGWWAGYALAVAEDRIEGRWVPRSWDQRHSLSFGLNWRPGRSWSVNIAGVWHTGWPTTRASAEWVAYPDGSRELVAEIGERNADRVPDYSRIDLRVSRPLRLGSGEARFFVEVMNFFDHENVRTGYDINFVRTPDGSTQILSDDETWFPIFPSFGFVVSF